MSFPEFFDRLDEVKASASKGGLPQRRKDLELYKILASCLDLCLWADREEALRSELVEAVRAKEKEGRNRVYVNSGAKTAVLVCRYVLEGEDNRNSIYRYAACLDQAIERQLRPEGLVDWLRENGGLNRLFRARPKDTRSFETRTLHLNSPVSAPIGSVLVLRLRRDDRGYFDVLED